MNKHSVQSEQANTQWLIISATFKTSPYLNFQIERQKHPTKAKINKLSISVKNPKK